MPNRAAQVVTRRALLGLLATPVLAGCEGTPRRSGPAAPTPGSPAPTPGPDLLLVQAALDATVRALGVTRDVGFAHRKLRPAMTPLVAMHQAHRRVFVDAGATNDVYAGTGVGGDPEKLLKTVRAQEQKLARELAAWAEQAEDGSVARLLATASAGVAQHLALLPSSVS